MKSIGSFAETLQLIASIKNLHKSFYTNFYPDELRTNLWIKEKELYYEEADDTVLFLHNGRNFITLFFCTVSYERLFGFLNRLDIKKTCMTEIISTYENPPVIDAFCANGFFKYSSLVRMSKAGDCCYIDYTTNNNIRNANIQDLIVIQKLLKENFDQFSEQIPVSEELNLMVNHGHLFVYELDAEIAGFLLYDLKGFTIHMRYWFVCRKFRGMKIGSALIKEFIHRGKDTKRQILWVKETNDNAIGKYLHYGFRRESMHDIVMVKYENYGRADYRDTD